MSMFSMTQQKFSQNLRDSNSLCCERQRQRKTETASEIEKKTHTHTHTHTHIYIYIYICILGSVKPELGVIPSGQEIIHD